MTDIPDWTKWHVGQKVVCVDAKLLSLRKYRDEIYPTEGQVYTIRDLRETWNDVDRETSLSCTLAEIRNPIHDYRSGPSEFEAAEMHFSMRRFRPLVTKSDPIEIFRAMTRNTPAQNETRIRELETV
jgi:hypothetical protein